MNIYLRMVYTKPLALLLSGALLFNTAFSQTPPMQDSAWKLSPAEFLKIVREFHPVAKQAALGIDAAEAELLSARGFFDPSFYFTRDQKTLTGTNYYDYVNTQLKIPTWFGVDLMAGTEYSSGQYKISERTSGQISYAGLSVPLAKNLLMDKRRAAVKQAKLLIDQSQSEQILVLNDLLYEAIDSYFTWLKEYQVYQILSNAVAINQRRYELVKITVEQGDKPGVDSAEAQTQLLSFQAQQADAYNRFLMAGYELSNYLWTEDGNPFDLPEVVIPSVNLDSTNLFTIQYQPLSDLLDIATTAHPKLKIYDTKLDILQIERQLKFQSMLPTVNLKYNALAKDYKFWPGTSLTALENNYKYGIEVGMPLFLRQGRGDYRKTKIKIDQTALDIVGSRVAIANKVKAYYSSLLNQQQQVRINQQALAAYRKVLEVENLKFEIGESTLFVLNQRENKVLESAQKLADVKAKFFKSLYGVQWAAGVLR